jgi:hypothetical protein
VVSPTDKDDVLVIRFWRAALLYAALTAVITFPLSMHPDAARK